MRVYETPRVYYEPIDANLPSISAIRTDVVGFVGIAERGPIDTPIPVESWRQFVAHFGSFGVGFLAYAVRAFFENGGRRCWVVRVASLETAGARAAECIVKAQDTASSPVWRIAASSPGIWGNRLSITVRETHNAQTLTARETPEGEIGRATPDCVPVNTTSGFERHTLVRISQDGANPSFKVVAAVDTQRRLLYWVNPDRRLRACYERSLEGFGLSSPLLLESVEYTLLVREQGRLIARYAGLSLVPDHPRYGPVVLGPFQSVQGKFLGRSERRTLPPAPEPVVIQELRNVNDILRFQPLSVGPHRSESAELTRGADGLRLLRPSDFMGEEVDPRDTDLIKLRKQRGFRALDLVDEIAVVAVPDLQSQPILTPDVLPRRECVPDPCFPDAEANIAKPRVALRREAVPGFSQSEIFQVQQSLVDHCEQLADRIALLDPPLDAATDEEAGARNVLEWRRRFDSHYAALFWPWVRVVNPLRNGARSPLVREVPPSGHVAGQIARCDLEIGVHKAPANAPLTWIQDVTLSVDDSLHGRLNSLGVNVIRPVSGRGIRILGSRTLSSNVQWRFLNVRRLLLMIAKAIELSTQWVVFEPNDEFTRAKIRLALLSFLFALWRQGALVGTTAEAAFTVKCDEENNPPFERNRGNLIADVSVAPSNPYEFVVLRVGRTDNEIEIAEIQSQ